MLQEINVNLKNKFLVFGLTLISVAYILGQPHVHQTINVDFQLSMSISLISVEISTGLTPINVLLICFPSHVRGVHTGLHINFPLPPDEQLLEVLTGWLQTKSMYRRKLNNKCKKAKQRF
jgi:hypothetical protein